MHPRAARGQQARNFPSNRVSAHCEGEGGGALENLCATSQSTSTNVVGLDTSIYECRVLKSELAINRKDIWISIS